MKSRRALRSLAERFAKSGVHALRFDYYGMGDSSGDGTDGDVARWVDDIGVALDELKASRGLDTVGLVGLRFGASLAALAAATRQDISFLVMWEPIVKGQHYLTGARRIFDAWIENESQQHPELRDQIAKSEIFGYPLTSRLTSGIESVDLLTAAKSPADRVLLVNEGTCYHFHALGQHLTEIGSNVESRHVDGGKIWNQEVYSEKALVPREVLSEIVDWAAKVPV